MLNASVGVQRVLERLRRPPSNRASSTSALKVRSLDAARRTRHDVVTAVAGSRLAAQRQRRMALLAAIRADRRSLVTRLGHDRTVAVAVAGILLAASAISASATGPAPATGGTNGPGTDVRIAVGGGFGSGRGGTVTEDAQPTADKLSNRSARTVVGAVDPGINGVDSGPVADAASGARGDAAGGAFLEDGTLLKPVAVNTTVADGSRLVRTYKVKPGDTLTGIASRFGISMMTIWWANDLQSKDALHVGQELSIPPVTGLVVTVTAADTLDSLAQRYDVDATDILVENKLSDPNLVVGQVLVIPGAAGKAIPTPKPVSQPSNRSSSGGGIISRGTSRPPATYTGGRFLWPVVGGGNYISQYFTYGHYGLDIAADYGSVVRAAVAGTVVFAGWKSNGGGYQVWISHGSNLYTTYNHMSSVTVGYGQSVAAGQQVGAIGQSGNATGPHVHFEVWRGPIWAGGIRVNPLAYE
ncbi:MAG: M23 family metallopeptidase [Chloroflexi bacterium]|nr:M23 family metallopeptidase [Chloroflexota bacterium]